MATIDNASDKSAKWEIKVNGQQTLNPGYGTISASGLYTAPAAVPTPATLTVVAISNQDTTASASATVTIVAAGTKSISVDPSSVNIVSGQCYTPGTTSCQDFAATVLGLQDQAVVWTPSCAASQCGSVTLTGADTATYTAPTVTSNLSVVLTATADADHTLQASSDITVVPPASPKLVVTCPLCSTTTPIANGTTATLKAQVTNASGWTVTGIHWVTPNSQFCISTDDAGDSDDTAKPPSTASLPDNCAPAASQNTESDGPGSVVPNSSDSSQATYTAPVVVFLGLSATDVGCPNDTDPSRPWVFIPVEADISNGGTQTMTLQSSVCLRVGGTTY